MQTKRVFFRVTQSLTVQNLSTDSIRLSQLSKIEDILSGQPSTNFDSSDLRCSK